ncbi:MAG: sarcosine oxidase subunit gamma family protein [Pseudomonadota bacterium]
MSENKQAGSEMAAIAESPMNEIDFSVSEFIEVATRITEMPFQGYLNLRGAPEDNEFLAAVEGAIGVALPLDNNTYVQHQDVTVCWLGPNEWLIICAEGQESSLIEALRAALADRFAAVTDVSGGNTMLEISGSSAEALIRKGCTLDIHSSVFKVGQCAQTLLAKATMLLYEVEGDKLTGSRRFRIVVRRSFADYLGVWLQDAAREFSEG